ncbi:hypothetical protein SAMN05421812_106281 [Asanoa hainanensis]|uniref:Uncharacterized protein n=1 Tax=Asanoa hainanensis TaxID=560556 RepID=A0A239MSR7_9ACTN|nr:hypothetical protein [Asanoa hainanensis]SNT45725.1 hypothetical protein SAMN05421812_106281 [Asanoa hainanensis]
MATPASGPLSLLAVPGERLGWIFNDRGLYRRRFLESPPQLGAVPARMVERVERWEKGRGKRSLIPIAVGAGLGAIVILCAVGVWTLTTSGWIAMTIIALFLTAVGGVVALLANLPLFLSRRALQLARHKVEADYAQASTDWERRRQEYDRAQHEAVDQMVEWGAAAPAEGDRRVDIVGGTTYGWEAVLTVYGGSLLATRGSMLLVDFTGAALCGELIQLATTTGRSVKVSQFPRELASIDLVSGLTTDELVDCLVEAIHGDTSTADRAERSQDSLLLREICEVLAPDLSMARLLAALRVHNGRPSTLTTAERDRLLELQPAESHQRLRRIESFVSPLATLGTDPRTDPADLTCLVADADSGSAQQELFKDLLVRWLASQVRHEKVGSIVLVGADGVNHRAVERLSTLCERRGTRLVLFFAHLREEALQTIGGGEVALMRLGNHREASQAAEFVGKGHRFVISRLTRTLGGSETHTVSDTEGEAVSEGGSTSRTQFYRGIVWTDSKDWGTTRNWSRTVAQADGTNWSDAESLQRVYEYAVEPRVLQDLPDYALLLVKGIGRGSVVQAVEVDPALVTLPRLSMEPLDLPPLPDPAEALFPAIRQPAQVIVSTAYPLGQEPSVQRATEVHLPGWGEQ